MGGLIHVGAWDGREYIGDHRRLLLFEPQAAAFAELEANLGDAPNVELVNAAAGAEEGPATMHVFEPNHSSSLLQPLVPRFSTPVIPEIAYVGTETVTVVTLDGYLGGRDDFDTLRIDTQGYELEVLRGAMRTLRTLERVELELHDPNTYAGAAGLPELDEFMVSQGFTRTGLDTERSDGLGDATYERS